MIDGLKLGTGLALERIRRAPSCLVVNFFDRPSSI